MRLLDRLSLCTLATSSLLGEAYAVLEGRNREITEVHASKATTQAAQTTVFPTVPAFSGPSFAFGAFSSIYPSGYTTPAPLPVETSTLTRSPASTSSRSVTHSDAKGSYLRSMCAPQNASHPTASEPDQRFPCNRVSNSTYTCIYNATVQEVEESTEEGSGLREVSPQEQQECLCPGGKGNRIWEDFEG